MFWLRQKSKLWAARRMFKGRRLQCCRLSMLAPLSTPQLKALLIHHRLNEAINVAQNHQLWTLMSSLRLALNTLSSACQRRMRWFWLVQNSHPSQPFTCHQRFFIWLQWHSFRQTDRQTHTQAGRQADRHWHCVNGRVNTAYIVSISSVLAYI